MNKFMEALKVENNYTYTENCAVAYKSTGTALLDFFGTGAAYRTRSDADCILLFKKAYEENPVYAMKCLFYIRDILGGQGERRFFRVVTRWLANNETEVMRRNLQYVPEFGRWDDLYEFVGTKLEEDAFELMRKQLMFDVKSKTPSLLAKWLKSENTSSRKSRELADKTRKAFHMTHKNYRKTLSILRERIKVLERLMSENRWEEIEFDKIPSKAGLVYRNAFARRDMIKAKYEHFVKDEKTTVNAGTLYPYEVVAKAYNLTHADYYYWNRKTDIDPVERAAINKYWANLKDYFNGCTLDALCMIDTSGSMWGSEASAPINVAISIGLYAAERARGPFAGHYISFSSRPQLIETAGIDFVDKVQRIYSTNLCENTNIEAAFDMVLRTAISNNCTQADLPKTIIVVSDMEFDAARGYYSHGNSNVNTLMESIREKWARYGYCLPHLIYWNCQARQNNIPEDIGCGLVSYVSGMSPSIFETILSGKTGIDLMLEKLDSPRYECIR